MSQPTKLEIAARIIAELDAPLDNWPYTDHFVKAHGRLETETAMAWTFPNAWTFFLRARKRGLVARDYVIHSVDSEIDFHHADLDLAARIIAEGGVPLDRWPYTSHFLAAHARLERETGTSWAYGDAWRFFLRARKRGLVSQHRPAIGA